MNDLTETTLGRYRIEFLLTETPQAAIYRGYDLNLERIVVVHVVKDPQAVSSAGADTSAYMQNFSALVRRAVRLEHPGLLRVYDFVQLDGYICVVTEYIEGPALAQLLTDMRAARRWLPQDEATRIVQQITVATDYAYANGIRHIQVTPQSIKFKPDLLPLGDNAFRPVVTDLGLFLPLAQGPERQWDEEHRNVDTLLRQLGALLFELLTGQAIDPTQTHGDAINQTVQQLKSISTPMRTVLQRLFATQPESQYPTLRAFLDAMIAPAHSEQASVVSLAEQYGESSQFFQPAADTPKSDPPASSALSGAVPRSSAADTPPHEAPASAPKPPAIPPVYSPVPPAHKPPAAPPNAVPQPSVNAAPLRSPNDLYSAETSIQLPLPVKPTRQIVATTQDGSQKIVDLPIGATELGRAQENDLVLEDQRASRRHAKVEWDGAQCLLIDQNSRNGTYLNEERLTAFVPKLWTPDQVARIGGHRLELRELSTAAAPEVNAPQQLTQQSPQQLAGPPPMAAPPPPATPQQIMINKFGYSVDRTDLEFFSNSETVALFCPEYRYDIMPGQTQTLSLVVVNLGPAAAALLLTADGPWISLSSDRLNVPAHTQAPVEMTISPPHDTRTRAGRYRVSFEAHNTAQEMQSVSVRFEIRVGAITEFALHAEPEQVAVGEDVVIRVQNLGNEVRAYHLMWWDESNTLAFDPADGNLTVAPGQSGELTLRPLSPGRRWLGGAKRHSIQIQVTPDAGENRMTSVEVINRSRLGI